MASGRGGLPTAGTAAITQSLTRYHRFSYSRQRQADGERTAPAEIVRQDAGDGGDRGHLPGAGRQAAAPGVPVGQPHGTRRRSVDISGVVAAASPAPSPADHGKQHGATGPGSGGVPVRSARELECDNRGHGGMQWQKHKCPAGL
jgi:hypothetical protein